MVRCISEFADVNGTHPPHGEGKPGQLTPSGRSRPLVLIPAYKPAFGLPSIVRSLLDSGDVEAVIVVDDGSGPESEPVFSKLAGVQGVVLIRRAANGGKGAALKTGLAFIAAHYPLCPGIVTADADGQHDPADIVRIAHALGENPGDLVLGVRSFGSGVPLRSRFGNELTRHLFNLLSGQKVTDTQTGLRGIPVDMVPVLAGLSPNGYDFELEMLLECRKHQRIIRESAIQTIYTYGNKSSHFRPLRDSIRIYAVFLRFIKKSLISAVRSH